MATTPPFTKVLDAVATHAEMFALFNRIPDCHPEERISGRAYVNQWFEIERSSYEIMLEVLPPLFMRAGMFAMSELKAGFVGSVFFDIRIDDRDRWFHAYCNLGDPASPDAMRAAIIGHEQANLRALTRDEKLELIWSRTHADFRGLAGQFDPEAWPAEQRGQRTILVYEPGSGTVLKLLNDLSDNEIAERLPRDRTI
ncbi:MULTISPECIES: DUF1419 domain-containing protein [Sphingomonadaceae]|uniref:DUF1419 domain-containing protein n=1 Tax=Rhizorhabdus wittichii TaxID=160791 RepID=A0A975D8M7_9SPHN|nr:MULTISPECIES: DUF1419 domain-containing protein [Sphingomonadaceae]QTH24713.1 DUF1419 domain-containing protein [Rhizorhabdus wittichii]QUM74537.1 DUF1419 domain-containing protein [Sphingopyxis granuli]